MKVCGYIWNQIKSRNDERFTECQKPIWTDGVWVIKSIMLDMVRKSADREFHAAVYFITAKLFGCHGNVHWQIGKYGIDGSSAHKARSYGEKIAKISPVNPEIFDEIRQTTTWTRNVISIRMFSAETTGPIFTTILHDIVALVESRSKTKPCYHLANVQRMHVVSICLHYGNIIWLPWQRLLTNWKIRYRSIIRT